MNVLFIDPGTTESAYCLWDGKTIVTDKISNPEMKKFLRSVNYDKAAIEMIASYGMPVGQEVFQTCVWIGRFAEILESDRNGDPEMVFRADIKLHHCHSPKGNDSTIRHALMDRIGQPGTKKKPGPTYGIVKDMWAALAGAVYVRDCALNPTLKR